jgi:hypothetical protein
MFALVIHNNAEDIKSYDAINVSAQTKSEDRTVKIIKPSRQGYVPQQESIANNKLSKRITNKFYGLLTSKTDRQNNSEF